MLSNFPASHLRWDPESSTNGKPLRGYGEISGRSSKNKHNDLYDSCNGTTIAPVLHARMKDLESVTHICHGSMMSPQAKSVHCGSLPLRTALLSELRGLW